MWDYRAKCLKVVDGDTLLLLIDNGLGSRQEESVRLLGVFAPEHNQPGGPETREFVNTWLNAYSLSVIKWPLYVQTQPTGTVEPTEKRTFTRYIAQVWDAAKKSCLNEDINTFLRGHPEWGKGIGGE